MGADEEVDIAPDRRAYIAETYARLGELTHHELLGVARGGLGGTGARGDVERARHGVVFLNRLEQRSGVTGARLVALRLRVSGAAGR